MLEALGVDTSKSLLADRDRRRARARRRALAHPRQRPRPAQPQPHPHRHLPAPRDAPRLRRAWRRCSTTPSAPTCPDLWPTRSRIAPPPSWRRWRKRVARTGARWIAAGFVHGVLNTDNINVTGESFDYGPWRFLPTYDPAFTAAYFDENGLYAFGRQPDVLAWNLTRLAECLVPLGGQEKLEPALNDFWPAFQREMRAAILDRLGAPVRRRGRRRARSSPHSSRSSTPRRRPTSRPSSICAAASLALDRAASSPSAAHYAGEAFDPLLKAMEALEPRADANLDHPYFARETPRDDADRRDGSALGADRRTRRLVGAGGGAARDRRDAGGLVGSPVSSHPLCHPCEGRGLLSAPAGVEAKIPAFAGMTSVDWVRRREGRARL